MAKFQKYTMFCSNCGSVSHPKCKFNGAICLLLLLCGFWPGLYYYFAYRRDYCSVCGYYDYLLPVNSPIAQRFIQQQKQLEDRIEQG